MSDATDMSTPVTRGELRAELAEFEVRLEQKLEQKLDQKLNTALEAWGGALLARIDASEKRLLAELARHTKAAFESMAMQISVIDEKYVDLPRRVGRLETEVFGPRRR